MVRFLIFGSLCLFFILYFRDSFSFHFSSCWYLKTHTHTVASFVLETFLSSSKFHVRIRSSTYWRGGEKKRVFEKRQMEGVFDGKGDSTSGRGCTSGVQGAKAQPGEEVAPWRGEGGGGVGSRASFKNTEISCCKFLCTS